jgi:hypothetical protein
MQIFATFRRATCTLVFVLPGLGAVAQTAPPSVAQAQSSATRFAWVVPAGELPAVSRGDLILASTKEKTDCVDKCNKDPKNAYNACNAKAKSPKEKYACAPLYDTCRKACDKFACDPADRDGKVIEFCLPYKTGAEERAEKDKQKAEQDKQAKDKSAKDAKDKAAGGKQAKAETIEQMSEKYYKYHDKKNCEGQGGSYKGDADGGNSTCSYKTGLVITCKDHKCKTNGKPAPR